VGCIYTAVLFLVDNFKNKEMGIDSQDIDPHRSSIAQAHTFSMGCAGLKRIILFDIHIETFADKKTTCNESQAIQD